MKIMVIDGNSILNRAFYGIRQLTNHEGLPTNAVYGFLATLFKLCLLYTSTSQKPSRFAGRFFMSAERYAVPCRCV